MSIKLDGIDKAEAWDTRVSFGPGWHKVIIGSAEEGKSSKDNPQIEMDFDGEGRSIKDWLTITPKTLGKVAQLLDAVGIDRDGIDDFDANQLIGKGCYIFVEMEPGRKDPSKEFPRVQVYAKDLPDGAVLPADTEGLNDGASGTDDEIPF